MLAFMPALRALLKRFVVAFFVLFDQPFQADISGQLQALRDNRSAAKGDARRGHCHRERDECTGNRDLKRPGG